MNILILGAGEVGIHLASVLAQNGEIVVMDRNAEALAHIEESLDVLTVKGDITHRRSLQAAGAHKAELVVAVTGSDNANLIGAALAAELGARRTVARVDHPNFYTSNTGIEEGILGVHAVLCASLLVGQEMLRLIAATDAVATHLHGRGALLLSAIKLSGHEPVCGKTPDQIDLEAATKLVLIHRDGRNLLPLEVTRLEIGDQLILSGAPIETIRGGRRLCGIAAKRGLLIGGGDVGMQLGRLLSQFERRVQIVEKSPTRAGQLAEELPQVNVILGDGSSINLLRDEHIASANYVAAITRSDEVNLMVSLLAKDLGVPATYTLLHRHGYEEVYRHLGVLGTTGPHHVLASAVKQFLPSSNVPTLPFGKTGLQIREFRVHCASTFNRPLDELALPPGAHLIGRVQNGNCLSSQLPLMSGQILIIASPKELVRDVDRRLEKLFQGKK